MINSSSMSDSSAFVVNNDAGQFSVAQMLSSVHNTNAVMYFLNEWTRLGAPQPKEFTCDGGKALIIASIKAFTQYRTIEEYVNASDLPQCFIRMDVAHFIKLYVNFLSDLTKSKKVKVFYKAAIGQLILCQTIERATTILKAILIVASCETDGLLINTNEDSSCETQKQFLKNIVQPHGLEEALFDEEVTEKWESMRPTNESIFDDTNEESENLTDKPINCWSDWFENVEKEVEMVKTKEIGIHDNPFNLPEFCARLKKDIKSFPLWSCIWVQKFGFGKIPASSSAVESEIKNIKKDLFEKKLRADAAVNAILEYLVGRSNIIQAKTDAMENKEDNVEITKGSGNESEKDLDAERNLIIATEPKSISIKEDKEFVKDTIQEENVRIINTKEIICQLCSSSCAQQKKRE